jgi:transcriptional regulator with XRE-family HTH domain
MKGRAEIVEDVCEAIKRSPLSVEDLAVRAGVSPVTIRFWLSGTTANPKADTLDKVCRGLGLRLAFADGRFVRLPSRESNQTRKTGDFVNQPPPAARAPRPRMALWRWQ